MFLARKVKLSKWAASPVLAEGEISADAVTADLRTQQLSLSFWECGSGEESELMDVILALASGADQIETIDLVWVQEDDLRNDGHAVSRGTGRTAVTDLASRHVEVERLDHVRLGEGRRPCGRRYCGRSVSVLQEIPHRGCLVGRRPWRARAARPSCGESSRRRDEGNQRLRLRRSRSGSHTGLRRSPRDGSSQCWRLRSGTAAGLSRRGRALGWYSPVRPGAMRGRGVSSGCG